MIVNLPTSENMTKLALRLHFGAWADLTTMEFQFDQEFEPSDDNDWTSERAEYYEYCQPELQAICTVIQQSNELALKARLCQVSPYLLLLNSEPNLSTKGGDIDFTAFRTLDAVDLPAAVNSFCDDKLTDKFIQTYNLIRAYRNQITHMGETKKEFSPPELLHHLVAQYRELWPTRNWLQDRVEFAAQTTTAFFHDGRYASAQSIVMEEWESTFEVLTGSEFKALFGKPKSTRRYYCLECVDAASTKAFHARDTDCRTAFLSADGNSLHCFMCGRNVAVVREDCPAANCPGNVLSASGEEGQCHTCLE